MELDLSDVHFRMGFDGRAGVGPGPYTEGGGRLVTGKDEEQGGENGAHRKNINQAPTVWLHSAGRT